MAKISEAIVVSIDYDESQNNGILLVGRKKGKGPVEIINAFLGQEALDIYKKLVSTTQIVDVCLKLMRTITP